MQKAIFYIGANNTTGTLEVDKIESVLNKSLEGYTALEVIGHWHGKKERTMRVEAVTDMAPPLLAKIAKELAVALEQEAIMLEIIESNVAFITA